MAQNEELEKRIAENMARLGGTHEFWERRLTHGWDALEAKLKALQEKGMTMEQNEELEKRIAENMARLGGTHEFWERRLTHGWDALEARLNELQEKGMTMEQIVEMEFPEIWAYYIPTAHDYARANGSIRTYSSKAAALKQKKYHTNAILVKLTAKWED